MAVTLGEKTMEMEYSKKDMKESPKTKVNKDGVYKNGKLYSFLDKKGEELSYESEKNAKVAYERIYG